MIYIYTLPSENLQYPDVRNVLLKNYLDQKNVENVFVDLTDYFLNSIAIHDEALCSAMSQIRDSKIDLLEANQHFLKAFQDFLKPFHMSFHRQFSYDKKIQSMDDFLEVSRDIHSFVDLFPMENYQDQDIVFMEIPFGYQIPFAIRFAKKIKEKNPQVIIIWGGNYVTQIHQNGKELLDKIQCVDAIVLFGHLITIYQCIQFFQGKKVSLKNTILWKEDFLEVTSDIDDDVFHYPVDFSFLSLDHYLSRERILPLILNYGCYHHQCKFCAHYYYYGNYKQLHTKKICQMIRKMYQENKMDVIVFLDECIPVDQIVEVAQYFVDHSISLKWMMETRIDGKYQDPEIVSLLVRSGCSFVSFGIESYNKKILQDMRKGISLDSIKPVLKNFSKQNVTVSATFMIGYPKEPIFAIMRTLWFIQHCPYLDLFGLNLFQLVRNSCLAHEKNISYPGIGLISRFPGDRRRTLTFFLKMFYRIPKIRKLQVIKPLILNRCDYLFLDKKCFSINKE